MAAPLHAQPLRRGDLLADPHLQFLVWFAAAQDAGIQEPEAMALATATPDGMPSVRMVLLKSADDRGYAWFTNHEGRKGQELTANPRAALLFHWKPLGRQIRIEGPVEHLPDEESDAYFASRPLGSRIGARVSPQSRPIPSRQWLEGLIAEEAARVGDAPPRPPHWGGWLLRPECYHFWQHRSDRVHDVFRYTRDADGIGDAPVPGEPPAGWRIERVGP